MPLSATRIRTLSLVALLVALLDWGSLYLTQHDIHVATLWPAKGFLLAMCLLQGRKREWGMMLVAGTIGTIAGKLADGDMLLYALTSSAISIGSIALTCALTWRLLGGEIDFREWKKLAIFLAIASVVAVITGISGGAFSTWARGTAFVDNWISWLFSTGLSYAIMTPVIVLLATRYRAYHARQAHTLKMIASVLVTSAIVACVFAQSSVPLTYLVPIALMIVSLVAEIEGVAWSLLATAAISLTLTVMGHGPTAGMQASLGMRVLVVQLFLMALTVGILPAAAAVTERRKLRDKLTTYLAELERASRALRESEARFRLMADGASDVVVQSDFNSRIVYISPSVTRILGHDPAALIGTITTDLVHPDDVPALNAAVRELIATGAPATVEYRATSTDGREMWFEAHPSLARDATGRIVGVQDIVRNITERKQLEAELVAARTKAEVATAAKADFLATMSHELRTPLTGIIGFSDLLHDHAGLDNRARDYAMRVQTGSRALLATVNAILDFSKLESGHVDLTPEPSRPVVVGREVLDLLMAQANAKGVHLNLTWSANLAGQHLSLDPQRFRQLLLNLVGNAVKFTHRGRVALHLEYSADERLSCRVEDTGIGIPPDQIGSLFERFSQADSSIGRRFGGTGLGLAICKAIVEAMEGTIGATSVPGRGATFQFDIPAPLCEAAAPIVEEEEPAATSCLRLLVVDDNDSNRALVKAALGGTAEVVDAASGRAAVAWAEQRRFDLILMDVRMPEMDGPTALRAIRSGNGVNAKTTIVAFTADNDPASLAALTASGFDGTLTKPLRITDLLTCVMQAGDLAERAA